MRSFSQYVIYMYIYIYIYILDPNPLYDYCSYRHSTVVPPKKFTCAGESGGKHPMG